MSSEPPNTTTDAGIPVASDEYALTVGRGGPVLLQDAYLIAKLAHEAALLERTGDVGREGPRGSGPRDPTFSAFPANSDGRLTAPRFDAYDIEEEEQE